ncbi:MAG: HlyD family secretion protein [Burkholderiales bacterium]
MPPQGATTLPASPGALVQTSRRKGLFLRFGAIVVLVALGWLVYWWIFLSNIVSTDNAYTAVEVAQITPSVEGTVSEVLVVDTQTVKAGDVLVRIDDRDTRLALLEADAELGRASRRVEGYFANDRALDAQIAAREADEARARAQLKSAQADLDRARIDLTRRQALAKSGSVSGDELTRAENAFSLADANLGVARANIAAALANVESARGAKLVNQALIAGADVANNPEVLNARARRDQAQLNQDRTVVRSPVDGLVARRQVQLGQRVQASTTLMTVVPVQQMHVDANFKESQLPEVRAGQPVEMVSDLYGSGVKFHGRVAGFSGGTGAAFAIIPAQNATGNWIKVVQRLPVRIDLDPAELRDHPLSVGLSMTARIDTSVRVER